MMREAAIPIAVRTKVIDGRQLPPTLIRRFVNFALRHVFFNFPSGYAPAQLCAACRTQLHRGQHTSRKVKRMDASGSRDFTRKSKSATVGERAIFVLPKCAASRPRCLNGPAHKFTTRSFHQPLEKPVGLVFWPYILVGPLLTH
jgi:hypothetical protein